MAIRFAGHLQPGVCIADARKPASTLDGTPLLQAPSQTTHSPRTFGELPVVTVQLPVFNERYVVERLIRAVAKMDYPADRLEIQVLDDSTDETTVIARQCVDELRRSGLDIALIHRNTRPDIKPVLSQRDCGLHAVN